MTSGSHVKLLSAGKRSVVLGSGIVPTMVLITVATVLLSHADAGDQIIRSGNVEDVREAVKVPPDFYSGLITLITASLAVVAFWVSLQRTQASLIKTELGLRA